MVFEAAGLDVENVLVQSGRGGAHSKDKQKADPFQSRRVGMEITLVS